MNKKLLILVIILLILIIVLITMGIFSFFNKNKPEWKTITLPIEARPDEVDPGPIATECQSRMNEYMRSEEFKNKGFSVCKLLESKVGTTDKECPNGFSPQGCSICKIMCR
jgi:hypothetical protein